MLLFLKTYIYLLQKLNKTRTVRFCCQGYEGNLSDSQATCKPICRGGCGRGSCVMPDICSCEEGYVGKHCTQREYIETF